MTETADERTWRSEQIDRAQIAELAQRYFDLLDNVDPARLREVFTPNGRLDIAGTNHFDLRPGERSPLGLPSDPVVGFTHCLHQHQIRLESDRAFGEVYATAYVMVEGQAGRRMLVRAIRYFDRYVRAGDGWLIDERHHHVHWMFEAPASLALARPERATFAEFLAAQG
jgi:hypothetical protein